MAYYIGLYNGEFVHTTSKKLRDQYLGKDYVTVYTLGTGKAGGAKIRGSTAISKVAKQKSLFNRETLERLYV